MSGVDLLPAWPTSGDSEAAFNTKADALGPALSTMITQVNTALGVTNISAWVSGAAYTAGTSVVWSLINFRPYRRKTTSSAGTTDPSLDTTNWAPVNPSPEEAITTPLSSRNKIINGCCRFWKRATSSSSAGYSCIDRWNFGYASGAISVAKGQDTQPSEGSVDGSFINLTATAVVGGYFQQPVEYVRTLAGKTVTLSYYYTTVSGTDTGVAPYLQQYFGSSGSAPVNTAATTDVSTLISGSTYRRVLTYSLPSIAAKTISGGNDSLVVVIPFAGTFNQKYYSFQLEDGAVATPFEFRHFSTEQDLCNRYCTELLDLLCGGYHNSAGGLIYSDGVLPVQMRAAPTGIFRGTATYLNASALTISSTTADKVRLRLTITAAGYGYGHGNPILLTAEL